MIESLLETALTMSVIGASLMVFAVGSGSIKTTAVQKALMPVKARLPRYRSGRG
ncbi:MAG: hypothetical protein NNA23_08565 [Nitrospira sp.]|nr:hypothetical protein [Nitrospira sp.]MCP9464481.1 hypothetical protein [Nitrospira sp.]